MKAVESSGTDDPNEALWRDLLHALQHDDGAAAKEHLQAGFSIYYVKDDTPAGLLIKEHPDSSKSIRTDDANWYVSTEPGMKSSVHSNRVTANEWFGDARRSAYGVSR